MHKPLILTMGDPTGIGAEIIVKAAAAGALRESEQTLVVAGDVAVLIRAAAVCGVPWRLVESANNPLATVTVHLGDAELAVAPRSQLTAETLVYGQPDADCGRAMADYITWAAKQCLSGAAAGLVTAPINKQALQAAGVPFPGHTEMLAALCGGVDVVMMLAGARLRVCMVTTHCALHEVPERLSSDRILQTIQITAAALQRDFGLASPRLAVLALNPHAGEGGLFGDEELRLIAPAISLARAAGLQASGPHSADTLFWFASHGEYDAVICMYHDQGLIPLKLLHFEDGVNVTLGLPIIRTSVDHGTAYDLAGTGRANPASLVAAVKMAAAMADNRDQA